MQKTRETDLASFHRFISIRLEVGDPDLTPEEALDLWRAENPAQTDVEDTTAALRQAIREMEAGDTGIPLCEFDRDFRATRGLSAET